MMVANDGYTITTGDALVLLMAQTALRLIPNPDLPRLLQVIRTVAPRAPRTTLGAVMLGQKAARAYGVPT